MSKINNRDTPWSIKQVPMMWYYFQEYYSIICIIGNGSQSSNHRAASASLVDR
jgi:hypothetical protein